MRRAYVLGVPPAALQPCDRCSRTRKGDTPGSQGGRHLRGADGGPAPGCACSGRGADGLPLRGAAGLVAEAAGRAAAADRAAWGQGADTTPPPPPAGVAAARSPPAPPEAPPPPSRPARQQASTGRRGAWAWVGALLSLAAAGTGQGAGEPQTPSSPQAGQSDLGAGVLVPAGAEWGGEPRRLPDWLQGLTSLGPASSKKALLTPLPTFRAVPRGAAAAYGDLFADLSAELAAWPADSAEEDRLWTALHFQSRWLLWAPASGLPANATPPQKEALRRDVVLARVAQARAGRWDDLARAAAAEAKRRAKARAKAPLRGGLEGKDLANEVQRRAHKGEWRSAAALLQSRGVAPPTQATRDALQAKLLGGPEDALPRRPRPANPGAGVSRAALWKALSAASFTTAPGPSGTRFAHYQALQSHPRALDWLGFLCDRVADGDLPKEATELLGLTKLTPLLKDGGGVRPVAGGESLRKLTARALVREHRHSLLAAAGELQFGAGRPAGAETLLHTVQAVVARRPSHAWVQLDLANAFNSLERRAALEALAEHAPALLPLAETFLCRASTFLFLAAGGEGAELRATRGVEQGDVLGPLLFAAGVRKPLAALRESLLQLLEDEHGYTREQAEAELVLGAYLDDTLVGLPAGAAAKVPELAAAAFAPAGLTVQPAKTKVWVPSGLCPAGCADWWAPRGLRVLGAPAEGDTPLAALGELGAAVGDPGLLKDFLGQALTAYQAFTEKVVAAAVEADGHWSRAQVGVGLLRLCALPRLLHLFRALPPESTTELADAADAATLNACAKILKAPLTTPAQQKQAALPPRLGGCGWWRFRNLHT